MDAPPQLDKASAASRLKQIARVADDNLCKEETSTGILHGGGRQMTSY
jgi:hypothetical protein